MEGRVTGVTGYTRHWTCFICHEDQESVDYPRSPVCHKCLTPLAQELCRYALGPKVDYDHPAVNREHFLAEAANHAWFLLSRRSARGKGHITDEEWGKDGRLGG